jgi:hypothetical protein
MLWKWGLAAAAPHQQKRQAETRFSWDHCFHQNFQYLNTEGWTSDAVE